MFTKLALRIVCAMVHYFWVKVISVLLAGKEILLSRCDNQYSFIFKSGLMRNVYFLYHTKRNNFESWILFFSNTSSLLSFIESAKKILLLHSFPFRTIFHIMFGRLSFIEPSIKVSSWYFSAIFKLFHV